MLRRQHDTRLAVAVATLACAALAAAPAAAQELTSPPELVTFVEATPPEGGGEATVLLQIDIGADGRVVNVEVLQSSGGPFDAAALEAARQFVFKPAEVDGEPAPIRIQYRYTFTETAAPPEAPPTATLTGRLTLSTGAPLAGAAVNLSEDFTATTDAQGRFTLEAVPTGVYEAAINAEGAIPMRVTVDLREPGTRRAAWTLEPVDEGVDEELVIRAPRRLAPLGRIGVDAAEARRLPGTQGDMLKVVQSLPGVAQGGGGSSDLVVWGAAPEDTRVLVDGVEIPALYHLGGVRSTVNSALVESIELVPAAFGPAYGRGLGGLVLIDTAPIAQDGLDGYLAADLFDASGALSAPLTSEVRVAAAGRYGYIDRLFPQLVDPEVRGLFVVPRYHDAQLRAEVDLRADERLSATLLRSSDASTLRAAGSVEHTRADFTAAWLDYTRILPGGASLKVTPHLVVSDRDLNARFDGTPARLSVDTLRLGLRASYREAVHEHLTLVIGLDAVGDTSDVDRFGSLTRPPREGDVSIFGQPPGDDVSADAFSTTLVDVGGHVRGELRLGEVTLTPGLRVDAWLLEGDRLSPPIGESPRIGFSRLKFTAAPRAAARWSPGEDLAVHAAAGLYHQPPRSEELSAVFGNPTLNPPEALHLVAGAEVGLSVELDLEVTGFYESFDQLVARSPSPTPPLARALTNAGEGRSVGAQVLVRRDLARGLSGWLSYTLSRSERVDVEGGPTRLFDFDRTHAFTLAASWELGVWTFGTRARYATGFPRTPVTGAFYDASGGRFQPIFGRHNSVRLPDRFQLDLRAEYAVPTPAGDLSAYLDLQNVTNHANAEAFLYSHDLGRRATVRGLPILAIVGGRLDL